MPLAKASKETLLRGGYCRDRYRDHSNGILQSGREIGLNSEYCMGKREFMAEEQSGDQWVDNYSKKTSGVRMSLVYPEDKPRSSAVT